EPAAAAEAALAASKYVRWLVGMGAPVAVRRLSRSAWRMPWCLASPELSQDRAPCVRKTMTAVSREPGRRRANDRTIRLRTARPQRPAHLGGLVPLLACAEVPRGARSDRQRVNAISARIQCRVLRSCATPACSSSGPQPSRREHVWEG